jgi:hypothetical protein
MQIKYILIQMPSCEQIFRQMAVQNFHQIAIIITKNTVIKMLNLSKFMSPKLFIIKFNFSQTHFKRQGNQI